MKLKAMELDSMVWTRQRPLNQEVMNLVSELLKAEKGKTYEVELDKPMKSLKASLNKHFKCAVKAKDKTGKSFYVKMLTRTSKAKREAAVK